MAEGPVDVVAAFFAGPPADVRLLMKHERYPAAIILMFSAMEALAQALRRTDKKFSKKNDFKNWVSRYLRVPGDSPTAEEWWYARCAIIHNYGIATERHQHDPKHAIVIWFRSFCSNQQRSVRGPLNDKNLVRVNILSMHTTFQQGVQDSLIQAAKDNQWWPKIENRLREFVQPITVDPNGEIARRIYQE